MNHGLKLHHDGTLELTMPKDKKITRVLVCQAGTQNGKLYYPERDVPDTNVGNLVNRQDAIDVARKCPVKEVTPAYMLIDKSEIMTELMLIPSAETDLIAKIQIGINATNTNDSYSCGMRNGMRLCMSLIDDKEPLFENCSSAESEIAENLCLCKCYITDKDGLQHEVIHTGDIRRVTGWEI